MQSCDEEECDFDRLLPTGVSQPVVRISRNELFFHSSYAKSWFIFVSLYRASFLDKQAKAPQALVNHLKEHMVCGTMAIVDVFRVLGQETHSSQL